MEKAENIRDFLGELAGLTIVDVTQDDWDEVMAEQPNPDERESCVYLHLSNGKTLAFRVCGGSGFCYPYES